MLEMSDIVLLITDIRHPVSTGDEGGKGEGEGRFLWGKGPGQKLGDGEVSFISSLLYLMLMSTVRTQSCTHQCHSLSLLVWLIDSLLYFV